MNEFFQAVEALRWVLAFCAVMVIVAVVLDKKGTNR